MGIYGQEFYNVTLPDVGVPIAGIPPSSVGANSVLDILQQVVGRVSAASGGGIVYFPPGRYLIASETPATSSGPLLRVPANVTLKFAPGAVLIVSAIPGRAPDQETGDNASIVIEGAIDAGLQQIFGAPSSDTLLVDTSNPPLTFPRATGLVRIDSRHVPIIRPEWWGAGLIPLQDQEHFQENRSFAPVNSAGLQAAFHAGWTHRVARGLPPIPIELTGPCIISQEIVVRSPRLLPGVASPGPLIVRGTQPFAQTGVTLESLIASGLLMFPSGRSLLRLEGSFDFILENLGFDAFNAASSCVTVERPDNTSDAVAGVFRKCTFTRARQRLVLLGRTPSSVGGNQNLGNMVFEGCGFDLTHALRVDGVVFRAARTASLHFEGCIFGGVVLAMIRSFGGHILLTACTFHCTPAASFLDPTGIEAMSGVDIVLERPLPETENGQRVPIPPGSIHARSIESQSHAFLHTFIADGIRGPRGRDVVLEGVFSGFAGSGAPTDAPVILWSGPGGNGANLILIGCRFKGPIPRPGTPVQIQNGRVLIGPRLAPDAKVIDLGATGPLVNPIFVDGTRNGSLVLVEDGDTTHPWLLRMGSRR